MEHAKVFVSVAGRAHGFCGRGVRRKARGDRVCRPGSRKDREAIEKPEGALTKKDVAGIRELNIGVDGQNTPDNEGA